MRLGGLISIMIQSILSGAGFGRSLLIFGTAMKVDLGEIISSCGGGLDTKGAELIKRHVGHGLIKTPEEAIKLLEISFRVPPALARHMNSVSFQQYFPLRRRFFSSMLNQWDQIFRLNRGKKKEVSPAQLAAGTEISKENAIESLVKQAKIFLDLKEHHRFSLAQLEYLSYNANDSYFLDSFAEAAREEIQTSLLTTGLYSYSSGVHDQRSRQFVRFVTNEECSALFQKTTTRMSRQPI